MFRTTLLKSVGVTKTGPSPTVSDIQGKRRPPKKRIISQAFAFTYPFVRQINGKREVRKDLHSSATASPSLHTISASKESDEAGTKVG